VALTGCYFLCHGTGREGREEKEEGRRKDVGRDTQQLHDGTPTKKEKGGRGASASAFAGSRAGDRKEKKGGEASRAWSFDKVVKKKGGGERTPSLRRCAVPRRHLIGSMPGGNRGERGGKKEKEGSPMPSCFI